jgi:DNA invertase Pin-like site-specific DNA recombinase
MVAIYARQSIDKKDSLSIDTQIEQCTARLLPEEREQIKVYADRGFSGKNTDRPQYQQMVRDIENGVIAKVIIYKLDRISRKLLDFAQMMEMFDRYKVAYVSCNENFDTSSATGRAFVGLIMVFAQLERETIQLRIRDNYYARGEQGFYLGGAAPFGYRKVPTRLDGKKTQMFEPVPVQAEQVRKLFAEYADTDISLGGLAKNMTQAGILTNRDKPWNNVSLGRLLHNPVYVRADADVYTFLKGRGAKINNALEDFIGKNGCYLYAERQGVTSSKFTDLSESYVTLAPHEGIIASELWLRCQLKLKENKQVKNSGKGTHSWLSGLMKCGYCGYAINVVNNNRGHAYINCGGRKLKKCYERKRSIYVSQIEDTVREGLLNHISHLNPQSAKTIPTDSAEINRLKLSLAKLAEEEEAFIKQIPKANDATMALINRHTKQLEQTRQDLSDKLLKLTSGMEKPRYKKADLTRIVKKWDKFSLEERKAVASIYIERVEVTDREIKLQFQ